MCINETKRISYIHQKCTDDRSTAYIALTSCLLKMPTENSELLRCLSDPFVISLLLPAPLYIPPHGLQFRIWGYSSEQVIFSRTNNELQVGVWLASPVERDQWFTLIYGTGDNKGLYAIKGIHSGKLLFSSSVDPRVGHVDRAGSHKDR